MQGKLAGDQALAESVQQQHRHCDEYVVSTHVDRLSSMKERQGLKI
jgi:hypothetical protein